MLHSPEIFWQQSEIFTFIFLKLEFWANNLLVSLQQYMNQKLKMFCLVQQKKEQVEKPQFKLWNLAKKTNLFLHLFSDILPMWV